VEREAPEAGARRSIGRRYTVVKVPGGRLVKSAGAVEDLTRRPPGTMRFPRWPMVRGHKTGQLAVLTEISRYVYVKRSHNWQRTLRSKQLRGVFHSLSQSLTMTKKYVFAVLRLPRQSERSPITLYFHVSKRRPSFAKRTPASRLLTGGRLRASRGGVEVEDIPL